MLKRHNWEVTGPDPHAAPRVPGLCSSPLCGWEAARGKKGEGKTWRRLTFKASEGNGNLETRQRARAEKTEV